MMQKSFDNSKKVSPLRFLPAVDSLLDSAIVKTMETEIGAQKLADLARLAIADLRQEISENDNGELSKEILFKKAERLLQQKLASLKLKQFKPIINATGIIIHTNLGRAPLSEAAISAVAQIASGYCTLEYDLEIGKRGRRGRQAEELLCELTGAESALIVNNCAAAAFLVLSGLGAGGEAIVSRGELVEIGGDFRVPEVMAQSGTRLVEVGTTNRTSLKDFADAITEKTKLIVRVHPSNFRIVGFTAMPNLEELTQLAGSQKILLYEDAGSGALIDLTAYGLADEPVISSSIKSGADIVTFSADKLLGGVQAGIIVGKSEAIEKLRRHPLYRALRVDKMVYAALIATLRSYQHAKHFAEIPVLQMLAQTREEIERRAADFLRQAKDLKLQSLKLEILNGISAVGGGSAPLAELPTTLISLESAKLSSRELEQRLRFSDSPIIARIAENKVLIDLRTVFPREINEILANLQLIDSD